ncbi:MAG: LPS assembly lipoprotein LptE [Alphaproteobacteria bacterium]
MQRRAVVLTGFALAASASLGACGFRPLLTQADGESVRSQLAAVNISGLSSRLGQQLRIALEDNLDPTSSGAAPRYDLAVRLRRTNKALAIQLDSTITRYNLTLAVGFDLRRREDQALLYRSSVQRVASYNVRRAPFATLTAKNDAERRAAKEIAGDIRTLLALHFQREADGA